MIEPQLLLKMFSVFGSPFLLLCDIPGNDFVDDVLTGCRRLIDFRTWK
ncbi:MAG: hypothetical protein AAF670_10605 [Planctomycetota bacterium]